MCRVALGLALLLNVAACDQWFLAIDSNGLVFVSIIGYGAEPRGQFRLRIRETGGTVRTLDVPASGQMTLTPVPDGELEVTLLMPEGCAVSGPNPQRLSVLSSQEERVSFEVRCS
jgi:hypothetical protein